VEKFLLFSFCVGEKRRNDFFSESAKKRNDFSEVMERVAGSLVVDGFCEKMGSLVSPARRLPKGAKGGRRRTLGAGEMVGCLDSVGSRLVHRSKSRRASLAVSRA